MMSVPKKEQIFQIIHKVTQMLFQMSNEVFVVKVWSFFKYSLYAICKKKLNKTVSN